MFLLTERLYHENLMDKKTYNKNLAMFSVEEEIAKIVGPAHSLVLKLMNATIKLCIAERSKDYQRDNSNEGIDDTVPMDYVGFTWLAKAVDNLILLS